MLKTQQWKKHMKITNLLEPNLHAKSAECAQ